MGPGLKGLFEARLKVSSDRSDGTYVLGPGSPLSERGFPYPSASENYVLGSFAEPSHEAASPYPPPQLEPVVPRLVPPVIPILAAKLTEDHPELWSPG